jgi:hypothetical protein
MNMEKTNLTIKLKAGASDAYVSLTEEGGTSQYKTVSVDDLIAALSTPQRLSTGVLPRNTRFFSGSPTRYKIGLETIARARDFGVFSRNRELENRKQDILRIPFPMCLFVFDISADKIQESKVFALSGSISKKDDTLYNFPFGNVYHNGVVCWGGSAGLLPHIKTPMNLISAISFFLDSSFNGDLVTDRTWRSPGTTRQETLSDFWSLVKYLNGKEIFPENMLVASTVKLTEIIKG